MSDMTPEQLAVVADRKLAVLYRRYANVARERAFIGMQSLALLDPTNPKAIRNALRFRTSTFVPGFYFTPTWKPEAAKAHYRLSEGVRRVIREGEYAAR